MTSSILFNPVSGGINATAGTPRSGGGRSGPSVVAYKPLKIPGVNRRYLHLVHSEKKGKSTCKEFEREKYRKVLDISSLKAIEKLFDGNMFNITDEKLEGARELVSLLGDTHIKVIIAALKAATTITIEKENKNEEEEDKLKLSFELPNMSDEDFRKFSSFKAKFFPVAMIILDLLKKREEENDKKEEDSTKKNTVDCEDMEGGI